MDDPAGRSYSKIPAGLRLIAPAPMRTLDAISAVQQPKSLGPAEAIVWAHRAGGLRSCRSSAHRGGKIAGTHAKKGRNGGRTTGSADAAPPPQAHTPRGRRVGGA